MTVPHAHPEPQALSEFMLGKLTDTQSGTIEQHLNTCAECRERAATVAARSPGDALVGLLLAAGPKTAPGTAVTPSHAPTRAWDEREPSAGPPVPPDLNAHPRYRVLRLLGSGGMGAVWLAEHTVLKKLVALKVVRAEFVATPAAAERFRREVEAVAKLNHPNIVGAHDAERAGDTHFLVMEYVEGRTLADRLRAGPLPVPEACRAARDAARGLAHAHAAGLVHRDVKPANLIRATDGTTKLLDFGLVTARGDDKTELTGANVVMGTPDYIAPEQAEDPRAADARSDVYALGCTLFHLLSGRVPFAGRGSLRKLDAHRADPLPKLPELPAALNAVLAKMTAKKPADRYATAAEVADALEPFCAARPEPAPAPRRRARWPVALVVAALALLCVAAAGAGVWVIVRDKDGKEVARVHVPDEGKVEIVPTPPPEPPHKLATAPRTFAAQALNAGFSVPLSVDGRLLGNPIDAIPWQPGTYRLLDTRTGEKLRDLKPDGLYFADFALAADGTAAVATTNDDRGGYGMYVWNLTTGAGSKVPLADPLTGWPGALRVSANGRRAVATLTKTGGANIEVRVVDLDSGKTLLRVPAAAGETVQGAISADGTRCAVAGNRNGPNKTTVGRFEIHDLTGKAKPITVRTEYVGSPFFVDGTPLMAALRHTPARGYWLDFWNRDTGELARTVALPDTDNSVIVSADGRRALVHPLDGRVRAYDTVTGKKVYESEPIPGLRKVRLSPDGRVAVLSDATDHRVVHLPAEIPDFGPPKPAALPDKPGAFNTVPAETAADPTPDALSPDGRLISVPVDGNLRQVAALKVYDTVSGELVRTLSTGGNRFTNHLFFPDGKRLITGEITAGGGFRFREWSLTGGPDRLLAHIADPGGWPTFFDLSADGKTFAFSYERPAGVFHARVVDLDSGKTLAEATVPPGQKTYAYARVSADGTRALTGVNVVGAKTATVQLHDLKAGKVLMTAEVKGTDAVIAYPVFLADGTPAAGVYTKGAAARLERYEPATGKLLAQVTMPAGVAYHMLQPSRIGAIAGTERSDLRPVVVDPGTGRIVFDAGKVDPLQNLALSADGRVMAVRSGGKTTVYRIPDGPPPAPADLNKPGVLQYQPPDGRTLSAAQIAPDGRAFLVSRGDRTELFDTATGAKLHAFPGHLGCFALGGTKVLCAAANNRLTVYDRATGKPDRAFAPLGAEVLAVFPVGPDAARVLVAVADRTFRLFDVSRGEQLLSTEFKGEPLYTFTADGKAVLIREPSDTSYKAYDAATGKPVKGFEGLAGRGSVGPFSADGTKVQSWDGKETRVVRVSDGQVVGTVPAPPDGAFGGGYTPDCTSTLVYRTNDVLELRDSITGAVRTAVKVEFPGRRDRLRYLSMSAASPDGKFALLATADGHVAVVRLPDPKPAAEPVGERLKLIGPGHSVPTVAFAPDGQTLLTASAPRGEQAANSDVVLWDAATGKELRRLKGHTFAVYGAAFSADGKRVVTGSGYVDGTVRVWDAGTGKELTQIVYPFDDKPHGVYTVAFAPDGKRVYSAGTDKLVRAWGAETGKELLAFEGHPDVVRCLALSPDGKVLASGGSEDRPAVRLWDAATGKELRTLDGHAEQVNAVAFSADGTRLASADCAGAVRVWDARTGKELKVLEGHTGRVDGLGFAAGGRLVTGGSDRTVRVWDTGAGKEVARFDGHTSGIISLAVSPCGRFALTGSDDNSARLWRLPDPKP